ncbi:hypothetical protein [Pelomonas sp. Root1444]|uniref:hypothetical protein n=1 Tax=Pelomonas sp. Root1444 TaxID=1736464 RepID=UPI000702AC93|nr:hypothetical protein [Pelomonas sp. Root1444]KQY80879.1 hypothetical protein ASD35_03255 [Pelomonas sp. Root1444]
MEELKALDQLSEPDERQRFFVVRDTPFSPYRPMQASDIYEMAERTRLHPAVPDEVRSHFAMAQNLLAYSWYCYPFNVAAELHAYISVEFALRVRLAAPASRNFQSLLKDAMSTGLITSSGFTYGRDPERQVYPPNTQVPPRNAQVEDYATTIAEAMRSLRNDLAHGTNMLHMKGGTVLLVCSELINQLFEPRGV